jgi:hypothetical protein
MPMMKTGCNMIKIIDRTKAPNDHYQEIIPTELTGDVITSQVLIFAVLDVSLVIHYALFKTFHTDYMNSLNHSKAKSTVSQQQY